MNKIIAIFILNFFVLVFLNAQKRTPENIKELSKSINIMKKIVLISIFITIYLFSFSQEINRKWNMTKYDESFTPEHPHPTWTYYGLKTGKDTLIDNKSYQKLLKSTDTLFSDASFIGGIREDSNRFYLSKSFYFNDEVILYDFNLKKDDTLRIYQTIDINSPTLQSIKAKADSVNTIIINGLPKKRLYIEYECDLSGQTEKDIWIEGIGSIENGFLNESCTCLVGCYSSSFLTCYYENNALAWRDSTFDNCYIDSTDVSNRIKVFEKQEKLINVSKLHKKIQIDSDIPVISVKAMDISGR
jgi:hypothetical protein